MGFNRGHYRGTCHRMFVGIRCRGIDAIHNQSSKGRTGECLITRRLSRRRVLVILPIFFQRLSGISEAAAELKPLSDSERQMLSFSESDPEFIVDPALVNKLA